MEYLTNIMCHFVSSKGEKEEIERKMDSDFPRDQLIMYPGMYPSFIFSWFIELLSFLCPQARVLSLQHTHYTILIVRIASWYT